MRPTFVIVGASLAGGSAAAQLRRGGFEGRIVMVGAEPHLPYERPPLSKEYLRGEAPFDKAMLEGPSFYEENDVEIRLGAKVTALDARSREVVLDGEGKIEFDKLLIATGCRPRRLPIPGWDMDGVMVLRTKEDADAIRSLIQAGARAVVAGMGFIGAEVAASLRQSGVDVWAVEAEAAPLARALGMQVGRVLESIHRDHGVDVILGERVTAFEGGARLERVALSSGRSLECDFAVAGLGVEPETSFLEGSGVQIENGVMVDEHCQTNIEGIFAAGDVANHLHPLAGGRVRVEHWQNARSQGAAAADAMLGNPKPYDEVHWFWSDQYEDNIQFAGFPGGHDQTATRGSLPDRSFLAGYWKDGRLMSVVALNRGKELRQALRLIKAASTLDPQTFADEGVDLRQLVKPAA